LNSLRYGAEEGLDLEGKGIWLDQINTIEIVSFMYLLKLNF